MIQRIEHLGYGLVVRLLFGSETGAINAVVDGLVDGVDGLVDLVTQVRGKVFGIRGGKFFELRVEHAHDLARLVVRNRPCLFIPQNRRGHAPRVVGVGFRVHLAQKVGAVHIVRYNAGLIIKSPTIFAQEGSDGGEPDDVLQTLQFAQDRRPVRPGTRPGDVQVVPACLRGEDAVPTGGDPIPKTRGLAHELPVRVLPLPLGLPLAFD
jgi:hypothetical protein